MQKLSQLNPNEVSVVRRPANQRKLLVQKSKDKGAMATPARQPSEAVLQAIRKSIRASAVQKTDHGDPLNAQSNQLSRALEGAASILAPFKDQLTNADMMRIQEALGVADGLEGDISQDVENAHLVGDNAIDDMQPAYISLSEDGDMDPMAKADEQMADPKEGEGEGSEGWANESMPMEMKKPGNVKDDHHMEAMKVAKEAYKGALSKNYKLRTKPGAKVEDTAPTPNEDAEKTNKSDDQEPGKDEVEKKVMKSADVDLSSFAGPQQKQLQAIFKSHNDLIKAHNEVVDQNRQLIRKSEDLEKRVRSQESEKILKSCEAEISQLQHLGVSAGELAPILKSIREKDSAQAEKLVAVLKSVNEQVLKSRDSGSSIFSEYGSSLGQDVDSPEDKLDKLVDGYVAKSENLGKSRAQIYSMVLKTAEGQKLYAMSENRKMSLPRR